MSWEEPQLPGAVSEYYPVDSASYTKEPLAAIGAWLIDQLEEKLHHQHTRSGQETISYSWWNSIEPKRKMNMPSVAISIDVTDNPDKMTYGIEHRESGIMVPAKLMDGELHIVTLARSIQMRDMLEDHVVQVIDKIISTEGNHPILFICKDDGSDDRGFSSTDKYMATSLYQMMAEIGFVKITKLKFGIIRDHLNIYEYADGTNGATSFYSDVIQSYEQQNAGVISQWKSVKVSFTPTIV